MRCVRPSFATKLHVLICRRFALLNAELTVKKVDYDYVHDARCSIQSYNR
jgi:hypothetical protein